MHSNTKYPAAHGSAAAEQLAAAQRLIAAGRLDEAESLLTDLLEQRPRDADALNAFGGIALARQDGERAAIVLGAAATAFPDHAGLVNNLGIAHQMSGRLDEAILCFERAVALQPHSDAPLQSLAMTRFMASDLDGARAAAQNILARTSDDADAIGLLGLVALASHRTEEAEGHLRRAVALDPTNSENLRCLSICCYRRHHFDEAVHWAEQARLASPLSVETLEHLARCHASLGDYMRAIAICRKILAFAPNHIAVKDILARSLIASGETDAGIGELTRLVKANPGSVDALFALACVLRFAGRHQQALPFLQHLLKIEPEHADAHELRLEIDLVSGRFPADAAPLAPLPRHVLVPPGLKAPEFILLSRLVTAGGNADGIMLHADERFLAIAEHLVPAVSMSAFIPEEPALALPALLRGLALDKEMIGRMVPYIEPQPQLFQQWRMSLEEHPRPWIGVVCESGASGFGLADLRASLPPRGTAVSLMTGAARHVLRDWPEAIDAGRHLGGFAHMIALIANLDAVVGPDVSALHLAGALGRPGFVALRPDFAWYWAAQGTRAIWYPSITVGVQPRFGQWDETISGAQAFLKGIMPQA